MVDNEFAGQFMSPKMSTEYIESSTARVRYELFFFIELGKYRCFKFNMNRHGS